MNSCSNLKKKENFRAVWSFPIHMEPTLALRRVFRPDIRIWTLFRLCVAEGMVFVFAAGNNHAAGLCKHPNPTINQTRYGKSTVLTKSSQSEW